MWIDFLVAWKLEVLLATPVGVLLLPVTKVLSTWAQSPTPTHWPDGTRSFSYVPVRFWRINRRPTFFVCRRSWGTKLGRPSSNKQKRAATQKWPEFRLSQGREYCSPLQGRLIFLWLNCVWNCEIVGKFLVESWVNTAMYVGRKWYHELYEWARTPSSYSTHSAGESWDNNFSQ